MDIPQYQDLVVSLLDHEEAHQELVERFNEFAHAVETFQKGGVGGRLFIQSELIGEGPALQVRFAEKCIRFSFSSQTVDDRVDGVMTVHRVPQHAPYEVPLLLGEFTFDRDGLSSLKQDGRQLRVSAATPASAILVYFLGFNSQIGFNHPQEPITSC